MADIGCFLKFGIREHLERLKTGHVFFSTAESIGKAEQETAKRGVGDSLEGGVYLAYIPQRSIGTPSGFRLKLDFEPAMFLPLFCLFVCNLDEVKEIDTDYYYLDIQEENIKWFQDNFMNYDSVAIIRNPNLFIDNMITSFGNSCVHQRVNYINKDATQSGRNSHPMQALLEISDQPVSQENGSWSRSFRADDAYKLLFQKDEYFSCEREYRFILKDKKLESPTEMEVNISAPIHIMGIADLLSKSPIPKSVK